uniref:Putative secreted peptide n=1 Tax=Anopheles braziliensis TaxID=58242 RepID=A0A2M3ZTK7_9DIPT
MLHRYAEALLLEFLASYRFAKLVRVHIIDFEVRWGGWCCCWVVHHTMFRARSLTIRNVLNVSVVLGV